MSNQTSSTSTISQAQIQKFTELAIQKAAKAQRERIEATRINHPHVKADTLRFNSSTQKFEADCVCTSCGAIHVRATSDFHQCHLCPVCKKTEVKDRKIAIREAAKLWVASQK